MLRGVGLDDDRIVPGDHVLVSNLGLQLEIGVSFSQSRVNESLNVVCGKYPSFSIIAEDCKNEGVFESVAIRIGRLSLNQLTLQLQAVSTKDLLVVIAKEVNEFDGIARRLAGQERPRSGIPLAATFAKLVSRSSKELDGAKASPIVVLIGRPVAWLEFSL